MNNVLLYDDRAETRRDAQRVVASIGCECVTPSSLVELEAAASTEAFSLLVLDVAAHRHLSERGFTMECPTIILSQEPMSVLHDYLLKLDGFTYFIAKDANGQLPLRDLQVTLRKILTMDVFGVDKYLNWGASNVIYHIRDSSTREDYIAAALDYCKGLQLRSKTLDAVHRLMEELLMNALYDAPRDPQGNELFRHTSRREKVVLKPSQAARLEVACDGERLGISVSDPFGAITRDIVLSYLAKCFAGGPNMIAPVERGGAGLGLFMCFGSVHSMIVNVMPRVRTEFIGLIDLRQVARSSQGKHPSFHFFATDRRAPQFLKRPLLRKQSA